VKRPSVLENLASGQQDPDRAGEEHGKVGRAYAFGGAVVLIDIYALAPERSATAVERFLTRFLPHRERTAVDYEVPAYSNAPVAVFASPEELIAYCGDHPEAEQRVYWLNREADDPRSAHVFFLPDGGLVFGLSVAGESNSAWAWWLQELQAHTGAAHGYWTGECPPKNTVAEFVAVAQKVCRTSHCT
jgi:hypothetical protein